MAVRELLCVNLGGDAQAVASRLLASAWEVETVSDAMAATRIQAKRHFPVGLMLLGGGVHKGLDAALEACIKASKGAEWVVVCDSEALASAGLRDLVLDFCLGHQTLPLDWEALASQLEHAGQRAQLRQQRHQQEHAPAALGMVGCGPAISQLRAQIRKVAATAAPVLIAGESGSGKELAAQAIHRNSRRAAGPFVAVNCGAISPSLIQSELFGHERGAFTGALAQRSGLIEAANHGTIFLDEIGDLPLDLQTNMLRFLQEKTINRVGAVNSLTVDVRVLAASHVDLAEAVAKGRFREDLYYRLNVLPVEVPPLRKRMEDVPVLAEHFLRGCAAEGHTRIEGFSRQAIAALLSHAWPGNVRELSNRVRRAVVMADGRWIGPVDLGLAAPATTQTLGLGAARTLAERDVICAALTRVGHNVTLAARELGVSRMTLYRLMDKHSIVQFTQ